MQDIGKTSFELAYYFINQSLSVKKSIIVDANFYPEFNNDRINKLKKEFSCQILQIHCLADLNVIKERFSLRFKDSKRHLGYYQELTTKYKTKENFLEQVGMKNLLLDIDGKTIKVDTTNVDNVNHEEIYCSSREFKTLDFSPVTLVLAHEVLY